MTRRPPAGRFFAVRGRDAGARIVCGLAGGTGIGPVVRCGLPVSGGVDDGVGATQPAARPVGTRHRRLHHRVRGRLIVGPTVVGWIADGPGGLERGFVLSALALWLGADLAMRQRVITPGV